ncbi:MAG: hypothetical protein HEQ32_01560 [Vampirovibrio sp.]
MFQSKSPDDKVWTINKRKVLHHHDANSTCRGYAHPIHTTSRGGEITGKQVFQWTKSLLKKGFTPSEETQLAKQAVEAAQQTFDQAASKDAQFDTILEKVDKAARAIALERLNPEYRAKVETLFNQAESLFTQGRNVGTYQETVAKVEAKAKIAKKELKQAKKQLDALQNVDPTKFKKGEQTLSNGKMDLNSFKNNPVYKNESQHVGDKRKIALEQPTETETDFFKAPTVSNTSPENDGYFIKY